LESREKLEGARQGSLPPPGFPEAFERLRKVGSLRGNGGLNKAC